MSLPRFTPPLTQGFGLPDPSWALTGGISKVPPTSGQNEIEQPQKLAVQPVTASANLLSVSGNTVDSMLVNKNQLNEKVGSIDDELLHTYSGTDIRVMIELTGTSRLKQLIELSTLTVSIHREKCPVRALGYINPKGFARGTRTIAGTLVMTQFTVDVLYRFLDEAVTKDISKDSDYVKVDQLPPFNMTLMFADEYGSVSCRRLLGVELVTDGTVYSLNDMFSEQTVSYMATDFTPLVPISADSLRMPSDGSVTAERSASDVVKSGMSPIPTKVGVF